MSGGSIETRNGSLVRAEINGLELVAWGGVGVVVKMGCGAEARLGPREVSALILALRTIPYAEESVGRAGA